MPTVAIIGRPNAGKSTLFNAVIGERRAIESPVPGTTRDRVFGTVTGEEYDFLLVDTGGLTTDIKNDIEENMRAQAEESVSGADCIWFCIDVRSEVTAEEWEIVDILRHKKPRHVPIFLIGTKSEKPSAQFFLGELTELGVADDYFFVSAKERIGVDDLIFATEEAFSKNGFSSKTETPPPSEYISRISILGRPNAGKSTFVNALSGREMAIVSEISGTTRDQVDSEVKYEKEKYLLIDTAGIRKKSAQNRDDIERYSRLRALSALERTDIAILLIDASLGISHSDQAIAGELVEAGVGIMIVFSKWDLVRQKIREELASESERERLKTGTGFSEEEYEKQISERSAKMRTRLLAVAQRRFTFLPWAPILFLSSHEKKGFSHIFENAKKIMAERKRKIFTSDLNDFLIQALAAHPPASRGTIVLKVKYGTQIGTNPPSFLFFANDPDAAHFSFRRYLENRLREAYGFWGTPIQIEIRKKGGRNPYTK